MVVATHSLLSYGQQTAEDFIKDASENKPIKVFLAQISNRVVLVDLLPDEFTPESAIDGDALALKEKELARERVFDMVRIVMGVAKGPVEHQSFFRRYFKDRLLWFGAIWQYSP